VHGLRNTTRYMAGAHLPQSIRPGCVPGRRGLRA